MDRRSLLGALVQRGDPNVRWLPRWPRFTASAPNVFVLKPGGLTVTTDFDERNHC